MDPEPNQNPIIIIMIRIPIYHRSRRFRPSEQTTIPCLVYHLILVFLRSIPRFTAVELGVELEAVEDSETFESFEVALFEGVEVLLLLEAPGMNTVIP
jgi:hypothetical protein